MTAELSTLALAFASCFSRDRAFHWFCICLFGMIVRLDHHGVTSFVRWLKLDPKWYNGILHFFQASSWNLSSLLRNWQRFIPGQIPLFCFHGAAMMVLDGIKLTKEGLKMPGNKKLHQSSENAGKAPYTFGHHFGVLGFLVGNLNHHFCIPVAAEVQEGVEDIHRYQGKKAPRVKGKEKFSVITLGLRQAQEAALNLGRPCMLILDAYYAVGNTFIMARECVNDQGQRLLHVVTRAKKNIVAYEPAAPKSGGPGRPPVYGKKVKLAKLFERKKKKFTPIVLRLYGKKTKVSYYCLDLIWKPVQEQLRFVLVKMNGKEFILLCSNLDWAAEDIIQAYSFRFKIEVSFKALKHLLGTFCYHFWCKQMPRLSKKKNIKLQITDRKLQQKMAQKLEAIERFVNLGCIALGMLQILAVKHPRLVWKKYRGWLRTVRGDIPSVDIVLSVIRDEYHFNFGAFGKTELHRIIAEKQREEQYLYAKDVA